MEISELLEKLRAFDKSMNEDLSEETIEDTIEPQTAPEMKTELVDTMSTADKLAAKTKIARALDILKEAVEEFKDASIAKLDMLGDDGLLGAVEGLDLAIKAIENALTPEEAIGDGDTGLNAAFADELPDEPIEAPAEEEEPTEEAEPSIEEIEPDFDEEAGLDLLNRAEEE